MLYPNDATEYGKELRLKQQFFFVSASLQVHLSLQCLAALTALSFPAAPTLRHSFSMSHGHLNPSPSGIRPSAEGRFKSCQQRHATSEGLSGMQGIMRCTCLIGPVALQDALARFKAKHGDNWQLLPEKACFQMNDTHPTIAVAEIMRLMIDEQNLDWETAWGITQKVQPIHCQSACREDCAY